MANFKLTFFLLLIISNSFECLKQESFCIKAENTVCADFDCGTNVCSINEESCMNLISWRNFMNSHFKQGLKKYKKFLKNMKPCITKEYKNQWIHRFNFG
jgi:hypothetical protein